MVIERDKGRNTGRDLAWLLACALLFRFFFLLAMPRVVDSADAIHYIELAEKMASGDVFASHARLPILLPALGAAVSFVVPDMEWACRIVSLIASVLLIVPVYLLALRMHGRDCARVSALVAAISPWLADYGCRVAPEALASVLWFGGVYALMKAVRQGGAWTVIAPLLFFGLNLARIEGLALLFAAPIGAAVLIARSGGGRWRRLIPFVAVSAVLLSAYAYYVWRLTGTVAVSTRISGPGYVFQSILVDRAREVASTFIKHTTEVIPIMTGPYFMLFLGVGLFMPGKEKRDGRLEALLLFFCLIQGACAVLSTFAAPRYLMMIVIAIGIWSARGMVIVGHLAANLPRHRWLRALPVAGMVLTMAAGTSITVLAEHAGRLPREPREYKIAGRWMKENLEPGLILSRKPQIGFYAGMRTTGPALEDSVDAAVARARDAGARYLVVDERYSAQMVPGLRALLEPENAPPSLRLLKSDLSPYPDGGRIVIYEVLGAGEVRR